MSMFLQSSPNLTRNAFGVFPAKRHTASFSLHANYENKQARQAYKPFVCGHIRAVTLRSTQSDLSVRFHI